MIFPIGDDNIIGGHKPLISYTLIALNIIAFLYQLSLGSGINEFIHSFAVIPQEIANGIDLYTLFSSIFLHGGWMHLIGNMIFLWIFADNIEAIIGSLAFCMFYIAGGLIASIAHVWIAPASIIPTIGASGAISAVMGAYLVMFPKSRIKMIILIFFTSFEIPAFLFLGFWFVQQLFSGIGSESMGDSGGIAWWAHIGGFVFGLVAGIFFRISYGQRYRYGEVEEA